MSTFDQNGCEHSELTCAYVAQALAPSELAAAEAHISLCPDCQREVESLRPVVNQFVSWPTDVLRVRLTRCRYAWRFASRGSMTASSFRATTTTVRPVRATSASGARPAALAFLLPVPKISCFDNVNGAVMNVEIVRKKIQLSQEGIRKYIPNA